MKIKEYYLHSRECNSFHFRLKNEDTVFESFTVTYAVDGTVIMSGDMGNIMWKRNYYPNGKHDYGFPNNDTGISYFAEKVKIAQHTQVVKVFNNEKAEKDIVEYLTSDYDEDTKEYIDAMKEANTFIDEYSSNWDEYGGNTEIDRYKLYEDLCHAFPHDDWSESMDYIGMEYDYHFKYCFELLKHVSDMILNAVGSD